MVKNGHTVRCEWGRWPETNSEEEDGVRDPYNYRKKKKGDI
jgi:hypothetical protein